MDIPEMIYLVSDENEAFVFTQKRSDNKGIEYIRKDCVEHIISGAKGPQDALNKLRSL